MLGAAAVGLLAWLASAALVRATVQGETPAERIACIYALADKGAFGAAEAIGQAATTDPDPSVRRAAVTVLARFSGPEVRSALTSATRDDDADVRASAAATLGPGQDALAADRLGELLAADPEESVRVAAISGLARNDTPNAIVHLLDAAESNDRKEVRIRALDAVYGKIKLHLERRRIRNQADWLDLVEYVKGFEQVQAAYRAAGRELKRHPEHLHADHVEK